MSVRQVVFVGLVLGLTGSVDAFDPATTVKMSAKKIQAYVARACGCMAKPKPKHDVVRADVIKRACGCSKPRPKQKVATPKALQADDGGQLFVDSATNLISILKGSIDINNTGKLNGLDDIFAGIQGLAQLIASARSPKDAAQQLTDFLYSLDDKEVAQLMTSARDVPATK